MLVLNSMRIMFILLMSINTALAYDFDSILEGNDLGVSDTEITLHELNNNTDAKKNDQEVELFEKRKTFFGGLSRDSSGSDLGQTYSCSFYCVGQWGKWRGEENTVSVQSLTAMNASDYIQKKYLSMCEKYPFHEGRFGGGSASVGKVTCY